MARPTPSYGTTSSSLTEFRAADVFAQNYVVDKPRLWIPYCPQNVAHAVGGGEVLKSAGAGTVSLAQIGSSETQGFTMTADADSVSVLVPIPADIDLAQECRFRVLWSQNAAAAAAGTVNFAFVYKQMVAGTTAVAVATTAMSADASGQTNLAADIPYWSGWSTLNANVLTGTPGDDLIILKVYVDLPASGVTDATVYGAQWEYSRKFLGGDASLV